ncbi:hypothetical protein As57867_006082, partial [Aphanomyces stellatus]
IWFRKGLRLHDNLALIDATRGASHLIPLVVIDPFLVHPDRCGARPLQFFLECLEDLDQSLRQLHASRLVVLTGDPVEVIPRVAQDWRVSKLCYEMDTGRYGSIRDAKIAAALATTSTRVHAFPGHTLYAADDVRAAYGPSYPIQCADFRKRTAHLVVGAPLSAPVSVPPLPANHDNFILDRSSIPTLADLGFHEILEPIALVGGESHALRRLDAAFADEEHIRTYSKQDTSPLAVDPASSSSLSPFIARGSLSIRLVYSKLMGILARGSPPQPPHLEPPRSFLGQLLWREFHYACSYLTPNYYSVENNPLCPQALTWSQDETKLQAWARGRTGYPWIDAAMRQLRAEGWIHNHARNAVACFLTRGDLWIDWRLGRDLFEKLLVDADPALNNGGWLWQSGSVYLPRNFSAQHPATYPKKFADSGHGAYIRRYVPALAKMPAKYIYEPWKASMDVQVAAGCILGRDYPHRLVIHESESRVLFERMNAALTASAPPKTNKKTHKQPSRLKMTKQA